MAQVLADKLKLLAAKRASKLRLAGRGRSAAHHPTVKTGLLQITPSLLMTEVPLTPPPPLRCHSPPLLTPTHALSPAVTHPRRHTADICGRRQV